MLRALSIRNFAVVEQLEVEFDAGFTVLTGETGAGKSILLDALSLLLGDRFEARQLRPGAERAEIAAEFDLADAHASRAYLVEQDLIDDGPLLLRRTLDAQGRSRAWINARPATVAQLAGAGESLVGLHGQHAHESFSRPETQRGLLDAFGGFSVLAHEVAVAWRAWREAAQRRERGERDAAALAADKAELEARHTELSALGAAETEWDELTAAQSRLATAACWSRERRRIGTGRRRVALLRGSPRSSNVWQSPARPFARNLALAEEARIRVEEAARVLRPYRERLDLDPAGAARRAPWCDPRRRAQVPRTHPPSCRRWRRRRTSSPRSPPKATPPDLPGRDSRARTGGWRASAAKRRLAAVNWRTRQRR
jgi:DNA repair protein RecN (Recombination protein N)